MKLLTHPAVTALGVTTLFLLGLIGPLIAPSHLALYHLSGSTSSIFLSVLLNVLFVWLLLTGLLFWAQRPGWPRVFIWSSLTLATPWILVKEYAVLTDWTIPHALSMFVFLACLIALVSLLLLWRPAYVPSFERAQHFVATLLGFAALSGVLFVSQLMWFAWKARSLNVPRPLHWRQTASSSQPTKTRVIWLLLDELSYQQVYEQRFPGLNLDAFDQLAAQSTVFTHAVPTASYTEIAVPSLMTGVPTDRVRSSPDGFLSLHNARTNKWQPFDPHETIFQDALTQGYRTGIAGWFNPYCRILPSVLDRCFWTDSSARVESDLDTGQPFAKALLAPIGWFYNAAKLFVRGRTRQDQESEFEARLHIVDYRDLSAATDQLLDDSSIDFVFLHLPVPHPGGIYDRKTTSFSIHNSSYIDNLALADKSLAHVRHLLEQNGTWDSSAVIVMGDHSWRTALLWSDSPTWTHEDQVASHGGQFDDRPGYIVKMPFQQTPSRVGSRFAAIHTRALLDGIIDGRLKTADDLAAWAAQQP
ncbi:type I phosphodiesterase/nucleotide pyrophosphatase [Edaphobacter aggregans]|uniref:Type I phosphodiesterase/nucleotide pyrophosphatase n=1 Tax=Edaphobacter aggregans TaxID=570835 RepID=A0A3R9R3B6_9BACT|nr:sulfatase-like hydrolase/transferase [Edaphobacter aggregans]RSL16979.1 type I phosphodiesterase/nucleotide pyrophosphatase [Edaphobacter aggregans]